MALSTKPGPPSPPVSYAGAGRAAQRPGPPGNTLPLWRRVDIKMLWDQARRTLRGQFTVLAITILLFSVLAGLFISGSFRQSYSYLHTIAIDSVPSVDAAQAMAEYIQDIDAKSADYLAAAGLTGQVACPIPGTSYNPGNITIHQCDDLTISNVGLIIALLVSMVFSFFVVMHLFELSGPHGAYGQMVRDDYDSVYYAAQLKHYGTAANADESRWLIALAFGDQAAADHWQQDWLDNTSRVSMLITRAQANRTWPEEDQPLAAIQTNWNGYFTIDGQIRAAARNTSDPNRIITAERISTGISNQTFGKFSDAVDQLSLANRSHFDQAYASEAANLTLYTTLGLVLFPLIGLLAAWGASRRFKDF